MYYQLNKETQKIELIFSKDEYLALPETSKREIKSNFLFSRYVGGWVSRCKWPNTHHAEQLAQRLGAENRGKTGETLSFAEQQERKAERAEARADRMESRSDRAATEGERLQKPINDMRGDIAFFTQPIINTSAGRAFARQRQRMYDAYDRGWEAFKKSEYYAERAEIARRTAAQATKPTDKGFCERRIAEAEKNIRAQKKNIEHYEKTLERINNGEQIKRGWKENEFLTAEEVQEWIERAEEIIEQAMSKAIYYREAIENLGGIQFSKQNLNKGDLVVVPRWGVVRYVRGGPKNFTFEFLEPHMTYADGSPMRGQASYAEIDRRADEASE